jgi:hypothetical protein
VATLVVSDSNKVDSLTEWDVVLTSSSLVSLTEWDVTHISFSQDSRTEWDATLTHSLLSYFTYIMGCDIHLL